MWDDVYAKTDYHYGTTPNDFLQAHVSLLGGRVLSLGEGEGRNAVFMAAQGLDVWAVDGSEVGLRKAQALADARSVRIETERVELGDFSPPVASVGAVVSIFVHLLPDVRRRLHQRSFAALQPGGVFLLEGYAKAQLSRRTGGPKNVDMLFSLADLREDFAQADVVLAQEIDREVCEGHGHSGLASVVQIIVRKPA
ncbi:MAG: class I SAM-dependent methyltransferase [Myxococcales bacterium]|nr:class I SAM-dependent methyltransferase [Myxococcales bacterium]